MQAVTPPDEPVLAVAVMGHPHRQRQAADLALALPEGATHHLVVQNDSLPSEKLPLQPARLVAAEPDAAICVRRFTLPSGRRDL